MHVVEQILVEKPIMLVATVYEVVVKVSVVNESVMEVPVVEEQVPPVEVVVREAHATVDEVFPIDTDAISV